MQSNQNVSTKETSTSPNYKKIIDKVFTCVNDHMLILIDRMLVTADEQLLDKAEASKSDTERTTYMDCSRIFRSEKNDISRRYFINLNNSLTIRFVMSMKVKS